MNELRAEIARLIEEHKANVATMEEAHIVEKHNMESDFNNQQN